MFVISHKNIETRQQQTYILQLFCNSGADKLDDAFWVAAWYFWAAAPSWLTCTTKIFATQKTTEPTNIYVKYVSQPGLI